MKFEDIKQAMDKQPEDDMVIPKSIRHLKGSQLPIAKVRKTMLIDVLQGFFAVVFFFATPLFVHMEEEPKAMYLILMFVVCTITVGYLLKMMAFHSRTKLIECNSKEVVQGFIFDLKILLETYKTGMVAASVLIPLPMAALFLGAGENRLEIYHQLFSLDFTFSQLCLLVLAYLLLSAFFYYTTVKWSGLLYGRHIKKLELLLQEYDDSQLE